LSRDVLHALLEALDRDEAVALATVVEVQGASPAPVGAKLLIWPDGRIAGTVGGGTLEQRVVAEACAALAEGCSRLCHYALREEGPDAVGMLCGGEVRVFIEVYQRPPALLLVGGGNVGRPLTEMARMVGFQVAVVDVDPQRGAVAALEQVPVTADTYVVIMTAEANADEAALRQVVEKPAAYIGMIGSRRKVALIFEHLRQAGVPAEALARVHAPIGLDLGGRGPAEVALSVLAEMVAVRYGRSRRPLSEGGQSGEPESAEGAG
jgi:xanthine dehydrogenase accessory factor